MSHFTLDESISIYVPRYSKEFSLIRLIRCNISNMIYACNLIFKVHKRQDAKYFRRTKSILLYTIFDSAYSKFVCTYHLHGCRLLWFWIFCEIRGRNVDLTVPTTALKTQRAPQFGGTVYSQSHG